MKLTLLEVYFLIFSFYFINVRCGKLKQVELDYSKPNTNFRKNLRETLSKHIKEVESQLKNDDTVEVFYEIKPPRNADDKIDTTLFGIMQKTISKLAPFLDYNISSEQTTEQRGNHVNITLLEYHLTFSRIGNHKDEEIIYIDTDGDLAGEEEVVEFIDKLYDEYEKTSQANYSRVFKIDLPSNSTKDFVKNVRKNFSKLMWNRKRELEKDYSTQEKYSLNYNDDKELKDIEVTVNFITSNNSPAESPKKRNTIKKQKDTDSNTGKSSVNIITLRNDDYDYTFGPIIFKDLNISVKEQIIAELLKHIKESRKSLWWKRSNTVLFRFEIPKRLSSININQIVEELYLDLEDVEPASQIHPAQIRGEYIDIKVNLPTIRKMSVVKLHLRFPHVYDDSIILDVKMNRKELWSRIEENLEYQLFMMKRKSSGERIYLNLLFNVEKGESDEDYDNLVQRISRHLKTIEDVKLISYEWENVGREWKDLVVRVAMPYSVKKAHEGLHVKAEKQEKKNKGWFRWFRG